MNHTIAKTPSGEEIVILALADYERIIDALDVAAIESTRASLARGDSEILSSEDVAAALAAPTPLAFWRTKRGLTEEALAGAAGLSSTELADLEAGRLKAEAAPVMRLARALGVRMEDLVVDDG